MCFKIQFNYSVEKEGALSTLELNLSTFPLPVEHFKDLIDWRTDLFGRVSGIKGFTISFHN